MIVKGGPEPMVEQQREKTNSHKIGIIDRPEAVKLINIFSLLDYVINEGIIQKKVCFDLLSIMN
jgi:hypothetical protein